jgi:predicted N-formylglutamate amidohydrolase
MGSEDSARDLLCAENHAHPSFQTVMLVVSCDHATCAIPDALKGRFEGEEERLTSSEGWAPGALNLAQALAMKHRTQVHHTLVSRLVIDASLYPDDPQRFSPFTDSLTDFEKERLTLRNHVAYFEEVTKRIGDSLRIGMQPFHLSVSTFESETADVIILRHHPDREAERDIVHVWKNHLRASSSLLQVRVEEAVGPAICDVVRQTFPENVCSIHLQANVSCFMRSQPLRWDVLKKTLISTLPV